MAGQQWTQPKMCMILSAFPGKRLDFILSPGPRAEEQRGQDLPPAEAAPAAGLRRARENAPSLPTTTSNAVRMHAETRTAIKVSIGSTIQTSGLRLLP